MKTINNKNKKGNLVPQWKEQILADMDYNIYKNLHYLNVNIKSV